MTLGDEPRPAAERAGAPTVLLVDDQPIVAAAVQQRLRDGSFEFHYCGQPANAVQTALKIRPSVILLDLNMPEVDGMTILKFIRRHPILADTPVIILSTTDDPQAKARAFQFGANDYIIKLPEAVELLARVTYNSSAYLDKLGRAAANDELARLNEALRRRAQTAEELFEQFMTHNPAVACVKDLDGRYVYLNRRLQELVRKPAEQVVGKTDHEIWPEDVARRLLRNDRVFLGHGEEDPVLENLTGQSYWRTYRFRLTSEEGVPLLGLVGVDVTDQVRAEEQLRQVAYSDALTGLPNRAHLLDLLQEWVDRDEKFALMFADLDGFKLVNDSYGHEAGDELLREIAKRFRRHSPEGGVVARLGGDEFTLVLPPESAMEVAEELHRSLSGPIELMNHKVFVGVSLGVAVRNRESGAELLRNADIAMYRAKEEGKGRTRVYEEGMYRDVVSRLELETELRDGVDGLQFVNYYQPIVCLRTGELAGFEALLRWRHPERGLLTPPSFIELCETLGLMRSVGLRVIRQAAEAVGRWEGLFISINLSLSQLEDPDFETDVMAVIEATGVDPARLKFEVDDPVLATQARQSSALARLPIQLSLNDFSSGQSSLHVLGPSAFDTVKLGREIVSDLQHREETRAIARHAICLARDLGVKTVAAGVEKKKQLLLLHEMGCDFAQGFLFSEAVPLELAEQLRRDWCPKPAPARKDPRLRGSLPDG